MIFKLYKMCMKKILFAFCFGFVFLLASCTNEKGLEPIVYSSVGESVVFRLGDEIPSIDEYFLIFDCDGREYSDQEIRDVMDFEDIDNTITGTYKFTYNYNFVCEGDYQYSGSRSLTYEVINGTSYNEYYNYLIELGFTCYTENNTCSREKDGNVIQYQMFSSSFKIWKTISKNGDLQLSEPIDLFYRFQLRNDGTYLFYDKIARQNDEKMHLISSDCVSYEGENYCLVEILDTVIDDLFLDLPLGMDLVPKNYIVENSIVSINEDSSLKNVFSTKDFDIEFDQNIKYYSINSTDLIEIEATTSLSLFDLDEGNHVLRYSGDGILINSYSFTIDNTAPIIMYEIDKYNKLDFDEENLRNQIFVLDGYAVFFSEDKTIVIFNNETNEYSKIEVEVSKLYSTPSMIYEDDGVLFIITNEIKGYDILTGENVFFDDLFSYLPVVFRSNFVNSIGYVEKYNDTLLFCSDFHCGTYDLSSLDFIEILPLTIGDNSYLEIISMNDEVIIFETESVSVQPEIRPSKNKIYKYDLSNGETSDITLSFAELEVINFWDAYGDILLVKPKYIGEKWGIYNIDTDLMRVVNSFNFDYTYQDYYIKPYDASSYGYYTSFITEDSFVYSGIFIKTYDEYIISRDEGTLITTNMLTHEKTEIDISMIDINYEEIDILLAGDLIFIGDPSNDFFGEDSGVVYYFDKDSPNEYKVLINSSISDFDYFGSKLNVVDNTLFVRSLHTEIAFTSDIYSTHVYDLNNLGIMEESFIPGVWGEYAYQNDKLLILSKYPQRMIPSYNYLASVFRMDEEISFSIFDESNVNVIITKDELLIDFKEVYYDYGNYVITAVDELGNESVFSIDFGGDDQ